MIPCVNCKTPVPPQDANLFAAVLVCPDCHRVATKLFERGQQELKMLLTVLQEAIRNEMVQGRLQFSTIEQIEETPKNELITQLFNLAKQDKRWTTATTSAATTTSSAPSADGKAPSS